VLLAVRDKRNVMSHGVQLHLFTAGLTIAVFISFSK
jgi:hypothetical protein